MMTTHKGNRLIPDTQWSVTTKRIVAVLCVLAGVVILYMSQSVLPFIVLAAILAFLLNPIIVFFNRYLRLPRWLAVTLAYLLLLVSITLSVLVLIPALINAVREVDIDVAGLLDKTVAGLREWLESIRSVQVLHLKADLSPVVDPALETLSGATPRTVTPSALQILNSLPSAVEMATGFASTIVGTLLSAILAFFFTLIYSIYISLDMPKMGQAVVEVIPPAYRPELTYLGSMIRQVWIAYLRGQILLCTIIGVAVGVGTAALGLPGAVLLGLLAGLLEVVPTLGPVLSAVPAVILALVQGSSVLPVSNLVFALIVALFYWIIQNLENNIIVPRVIGNAIEVHPILVMAGVVVGASIGGLFGALIASPILATMRVLAHYVYFKMIGLPPYPELELQMAAEGEDLSPFEMTGALVGRLTHYGERIKKHGDRAALAGKPLIGKLADYGGRIEGQYGKAARMGGPVVGRLASYGEHLKREVDRLDWTSELLLEKLAWCIERIRQALGRAAVTGKLLIGKVAPYAARLKDAPEEAARLSRLLADRSARYREQIRQVVDKYYAQAPENRD